MRFFSTLIASVLGTLIALGVVFFFGFLFLMALIASSDATPPVRAGSVLVLDLSGAIPEQVSGDPLNQAIGGEAPYDLYDLTHALEKAAVDDRIEAVWLKTQGVAASWATLQEIRSALLNFKTSGKPLIASAGDAGMGEAEYFLATAADSVFAAPQSIFEMNGFALEVVFFTNMLNRLDIEPQVVRAGTYKSAVEPFFRTDLSPENQEQLTALLDAQNRVFLDAVTERRGRTAAELDQLLQQEAFLTAEAAAEAGLLDGLLYEDQVIDLLKARLGIDADDDLRTVQVKSYVRVPDAEAGLDVGRDADIAIVYAVGTIMPGTSSTGGILGSDTFNDAMQEARESDRVKAVVLRIDSPGGSASASEAMWREIKLTAEEKPVIVSMGGVAASGGYWIATAGDAIVADPLTITGSIGVFTLFFDIGDFLDNKLGITTDGVTTSPYADMFSGMRPLSEREEAVLQRFTDETYQDFLAKVAESRGLDVVQVDSIGQGRVWIGEQARAIGLVDELGSLDTAIQRAAERAELEPDTYRLRHLPRPKTLVEELNEIMGVEAAHVWQRLRTSPTERALLHQLRRLEEAAALHGTIQARLPLDIRIR